MAYASFYDAYKAKNPDYNPWSAQQKQQLADAYSAKNPTWTPTKDAASVTVNPVTFNPYSDPNYILGAAGVNQSLANSQADYDYGVLRGNQNFGYDAAGNIVSGGAGYNPYSQATLLQRSYDQTKRGSVNSYAAQGQLYSGALKNRQASDLFNFNRSSDSLQRGASDYYHGLTSSLNATKAAGQTKLADLILAALSNHLSSQQG